MKRYKMNQQPPGAAAPRPPAPPARGDVLQAIQQFGCWIAVGAGALAIIALIIGAVGWGRPPTGPLEGRVEVVEGRIQTLAAENAAQDSAIAEVMAKATDLVVAESQVREATDLRLEELLQAESAARKGLDSRVTSVTSRVTDRPKTPYKSTIEMIKLRQE